MYSATSKFIKLMEKKGIKYDFQGIRNPKSEKEVVVVRYSGDNMKTIEVTFFFNKDNEDAAIRVFDMLSVPANKLEKILVALNEQNNKWRFAKFCLDTSDNTIQLEMDPVFRDHDVADICVELLSRSVNIADSAYPEFMKYIYS